MSEAAVMEIGSPAAAPAKVRIATATGASRIQFEDVSVSYGGLTVLRDLNLTVHPGEIVALIGPSGSGKTTALRTVAGFVRPSSGRILIGDRDVTDLPPYDRRIGMVVQNYALFPHMRVEENVAFGLRAQGAERRLIAGRVAECLELVGMARYAKRLPRELSGGQQQRVAIARALAVKPQVLLLDEPLSALDTQIRRSMVEEIAKLHRDLPELTVLYVTHDQSEALTLADHIGIMRDGRLLAFGETQALFQAPPTRFAAEFLGRANLLPVQHRGRGAVLFAGTALSAHDPHGLATGGALLCIRPHHLRLAPGPGLTNRLTATVTATQWQGDALHITLDAEGETLRLTCPPMPNHPGYGARLDVFFDPTEVTLVPEDASHV
jgi:2-aminoethylphosphonate transport system ATP-binding protein